MGIPEHVKCVKTHKWLRHDKQHGNWKKVRKIRRANGEIKHKMRIRQMLKAEFLMQKARHKNYTEFMKKIYSPHYRRYGKYDD